MCFTVLQRTDKTGTETDKDIHSESLNSTHVIWLSISHQCQNRETLHLLGKESKGMCTVGECTSVHFFAQQQHPPLAEKVNHSLESVVNNTVVEGTDLCDCGISFFLFRFNMRSTH